MHRNPIIPIVDGGPVLPFRHSTVTLGSARAVDVNLLQKLHFIVPRSALSVLPGVVSTSDVPICSRGVQTMIAPVIQELHFGLSKSEYVCIECSIPPRDRTVIVGDICDAITQSDNISCSDVPTQSDFLTQSDNTPKCDIPTQSDIFIDPALLQIVSLQAVLIEPPIASPIATESSEEIIDADGGAKFVAEFIERNALRQQTRDEVKLELREQVREELKLERRNQCKVESNSFSIVDIKHAFAVETLSLINIDNSFSGQLLSQTFDHVVLTVTDEVPAVIKKRSAFGTFLAITALIKLQRRIKRRYKEQQDNLINSLGLI